MYASLMRLSQKWVMCAHLFVRSLVFLRLHLVRSLHLLQSDTPLSLSTHTLPQFFNDYKHGS